MLRGLGNGSFGTVYTAHTECYVGGACLDAALQFPRHAVEEGWREDRHLLFSITHSSIVPRIGFHRRESPRFDAGRVYKAWLRHRLSDNRPRLGICRGVSRTR